MNTEEGDTRPERGSSRMSSRTTGAQPLAASWSKLQVTLTHRELLPRVVTRVVALGTDSRGVVIGIASDAPSSDGSRWLLGSSFCGLTGRRAEWIVLVWLESG